jgi:hypothetical protein
LESFEIWNYAKPKAVFALHTVPSGRHIYNRQMNLAGQLHRFFDFVT